MKQDTKKLIALAGIAGVGIYFLMPRDEDFTGLGGGGGIPLLPEVEEAAESGDVIYNLPTMPEYIIDFQPDVAPKKLTYAPSLIPTRPLEYYAAGGVSELSEFARPEQKLKSVMELQHYADPFAYVFSGRTDKFPETEPLSITETIAKPKKPVQFEEATLGGFFDFLAPITQLGKGAIGRTDIYRSKEDPKTIGEVKKAAIARGERGTITADLVGRYARRSGAGRERRDPISSMGQRAYSGARSTALSSLKKSRKRAGSPD